MEDNLDKIINDAFGDIAVNEINRHLALLNDMWTLMSAVGILSKTGQLLQDNPDQGSMEIVHNSLEKIYEVMMKWKDLQG